MNVQSKPSPTAPTTPYDRTMHYLTNRTQKWWATVAVIASGGVFATAIFMNTFAESDTIQIDAPNETEDLARFTDTSAPLAMMGSSAMAQFEATDSTPAKLELIYQGLESFDRWLAPTMDQVIHRELAREALRMQEIAIKESNNGAYDTSDPLSNFDFGSCLASLPGDRCVLLRMAGEGIALFAKCINGPGAVPPKNLHPDETPFSDRYCNEKPLTEGPPDALYGMTHGYLRMRAALLALGQFEIESQTKTEAPLHALSNYRESIYQALKLSPAAINSFQVDLPNAMGMDSPAESVERAYPVD